MPVKSKKQLKLMEAAAHGAGFGPSKKVAKEMLDKTPTKTKKFLMKK